MTRLLHWIEGWDVLKAHVAKLEEAASKLLLELANPAVDWVMRKVRLEELRKALEDK